MGLLGLLGWFLSGGALGALFIGILGCLWIAYDARQKGTSRPPALTLAIIATAATLPAVLFTLDPMLALTNLTLAPIVGWLGVIGGLTAIFAVIAYALGWWGRGVIVVIAGTPDTVRKPRPPAPPPTDATQAYSQRALATAWLVAKSGNRAGQQYPLSTGTNSIGRSARMNLVVEDGKVSGEHAKIIFENGQFVIYDLGSLNHTFVNGRQVQRQMLMDGDEIRLGESRFVFKKA